MIFDTCYLKITSNASYMGMRILGYVEHSDHGKSSVVKLHLFSNIRILHTNLTFPLFSLYRDIHTHKYQTHRKT